MKILITNDDGVRAQGINALFHSLKKNWDVTMIAPGQERSSCGHGITLGEPIRADEISENIYECTGLPADCILVGLGHFFKEQKPDLVISGINHGANLGQDRFYSGTMAAAREASFRGIPSIAISLATKIGDGDFHFKTACDFLNDAINKGLHLHIPPMGMLNINVPNVPKEDITGYKDGFAGFQKYSDEVIERTDGRGKKYFWIGGTHSGHEDIPGSDCNLIRDKYISLDLHDISGRCFKYQEQLGEVLKNLKI